MRMNPVSKAASMLPLNGNCDDMIVNGCAKCPFGVGEGVEESVLIIVELSLRLTDGLVKVISAPVVKTRSHISLPSNS